MSARDTIVIIGGGLAGAKAAEGAREQGFDGRVVLIGEEPGLPYERPPLSKAVLRGEAEVQTTEVRPLSYYDDHDIELVAEQTVTELDPGRHEVRLGDGEVVAFTRAILATGSEPRTLSVAGADLEGIYGLRTSQDSIALRDAIAAAGRIAVVGAGWIGSEVAASARQVGTDVVMIDASTTPLQRVVGHNLGDRFAQLHASHGVKLQLATGVVSLEGTKAVERVVLSNGDVEDVDLVVVGIGVDPRVDLAVRAGLTVENGVVVDDHLRTSHPDIYACGDIASAWHPHHKVHLRVEHWANALNQGLAAGRNAAGGDVTYDRLPYFYSDQYDLGLEYVGNHSPGDTIEVREVDEGAYLAFWHTDGIVTAAMTVNVWDVVDHLKALVLHPGPVDPHLLVDPSVPLTELFDATT